MRSVISGGRNGIGITKEMQEEFKVGGPRLCDLSTQCQCCSGCGRYDDGTGPKSSRSIQHCGNMVPLEEVINYSSPIRGNDMFYFPKPCMSCRHLHSRKDASKSKSPDH